MLIFKTGKEIITIIESLYKQINGCTDVKNARIRTFVPIQAFES